LPFVPTPILTTSGDTADTGETSAIVSMKKAETQK
jgi:hypothetical protein